MCHLKGYQYLITQLFLLGVIVFEKREQLILISAPEIRVNLGKFALRL